MRETMGVIHALTYLLSIVDNLELSFWQYNLCKYVSGSLLPMVNSRLEI